MLIDLLSRTDEEVFRDTWEMKCKAAAERRAAVLKQREQAMHDKLLRVQHAQQAQQLAEIGLAKMQSTEAGVYLMDQQVLSEGEGEGGCDGTAGIQNKAAAMHGSSASAGVSEIGGGLIQGGICHGNSGKTAAVFNRVYLQPVTVPKDDAAKVKVR